MTTITWRLVNLHPNDPAIQSSVAFAVHGRIQVGHASRPGPGPHAVWWKSTANSLSALEEGSGYASSALGISGNQVAGYIQFAAGVRAARWTLGGQRVILAKSPSLGTAQGTKGTGGDSAGQATLWDPDGLPKVMHPADAVWSRVYGVHADRQAGVVTTAMGDQAALWNSTEDSFVLLHPEGASVSQAFGIYGDRQVGHVSHRSCLWRDAAHRLTYLHPAGYQTSVARAVHRHYQAGWAWKKGNDRAGVWQDTPESWMDLHQHLPSSFSRSQAWGIWSHANVIRVVGYGYNSALGRGEALLWIGQVIAPTVPQPPQPPDLPVHP